MRDITVRENSTTLLILQIIIFAIALMYASLMYVSA